MHRQLLGTTAVGLAFEVADLTLLQGWADWHRLRMVVELNHWAADSECEEVVVVYAKNNCSRRWHLWRSLDSVIVQPLLGKNTRFPSVAEAIEAISLTLR